MPDSNKPQADDDAQRFRLPENATGRANVGCASIPLALFAVWLYWFFNKFPAGPHWVEWVVRHLLEELGLGAAIFSLVLMIWALFKPTWIRRIANVVFNHLKKSVVLIAILFGVPIVLIMVIGTVMDWVKMFE